MNAEEDEMTLIIVGVGVVLVIVMIAVYMISSGPRVGKTPEDIPPETMTHEYILQTAKRGKLIQAIKEYRALHGVDLREAKEAVEEMLRRS